MEVIEHVFESRRIAGEHLLETSQREVAGLAKEPTDDAGLMAMIDAQALSVRSTGAADSADTVLGGDHLVVRLDRQVELAHQLASKVALRPGCRVERRHRPSLDEIGFHLRGQVGRVFTMLAGRPFFVTRFAPGRPTGSVSIKLIPRLRLSALNALLGFREGAFSARRRPAFTRAGASSVESAPGVETLSGDPRPEGLFAVLANLGFARVSGRGHSENRTTESTRIPRQALFHLVGGVSL